MWFATEDDAEAAGYSKPKSQSRPPTHDEPADDTEDALDGQKVNPYGFRLGFTTDWKSRWFRDRDYKDYLTEDWKIREYIMRGLASAAIRRIDVERTSDKLRVDVHTARPAS